MRYNINICEIQQIFNCVSVKIFFKNYLLAEQKHKILKKKHKNRKYDTTFCIVNIALHKTIRLHPRIWYDTISHEFEEINIRKEIT